MRGPVGGWEEAKATDTGALTARAEQPRFAQQAR